MIKNICIVCGKTFHSPYFMGEEKFCSEKCRKIFRKVVNAVKSEIISDLEKYFKELDDKKDLEKYKKRLEYQKNYRKKKLELRKNDVGINEQRKSQSVVVCNGKSY